MELQNLIDHGIKNNASDILISAGNPPYYRIYSELSVLKITPLTKEEIVNLLQSLLTEEKYNLYLKQLEYNFTINYSNNRLRIRVFNSFNGPAITIRIIPNAIKTFETIKAPSIITELCNINKGLILVTGGNSCGKTTTLNAMINHINNNDKKHIITIENSPEYLHITNQSLIHQKDITSTSYEQALKSSMYEDPDIIVIDSLNNPSQIRLALEAAERGFLILSTLYTQSVTSTIELIINSFPSEERDFIKSLLSRTLEGIISQTLLKKLDGSGVEIAFEIMRATNEVRNLIKSGNIQDINSLIEKGKNQGMMTMKDSITNLIQQGIISSEILEEFHYDNLTQSNEDLTTIDKNSF